MTTRKPVNILMVDDQPAKLLSYEVILNELDEHLIKANSANEALSILLTTDVAVLLVDVCMPDLDGFQLVDLIRQHPRFEKIAIIFVSAVQLTDIDRVRGYSSGAVDYVSVPFVAEILRAKIRVFVELYRKTKQLEQLASDLEQRVEERTRELEASTKRLQESDERFRQALSAGKMGTWQRNITTGKGTRDRNLNSVLGLPQEDTTQGIDDCLKYVHPDDRQAVAQAWQLATTAKDLYEAEFRIVRADGKTRWLREQGRIAQCPDGSEVFLTGLALDITDRKRSEERQELLIQELNHRVKNILAMVQSIATQTLSGTNTRQSAAFIARLQSLAACQNLLTQNHWDGAHLGDILKNTFAPHNKEASRIEIAGDDRIVTSRDAISISLALHELATNAVKYGALANEVGKICVSWSFEPQAGNSRLQFDWREENGPPVTKPAQLGFGSRLLRSLAGQSGASYVSDFAASGFQCQLTLPLEAAQ